MEELRTLNFKIPASLHERLKDQAENEGRSISAMIRMAMDEYCGGFEIPPGPKLSRRRQVAGTPSE
jgi:hypothetical protein